MSAKQRVVVKKGRTTRLQGKASLNNAAYDLTAGGISLEVKLATVDQTIDITATSGLGVAVDDYWFEVTAANQATLGNPEQIYVVVSVFGPSNVLIMQGDATLNVVL